MSVIAIDNKQFFLVNNDKGLSTKETIFKYSEKNGVITGSYKGGNIKKGQILGKRVGENELELLFHSITNDGELKSGKSKGVIAKDKKRKTTLSFDWYWFDQDVRKEKSFYIEKI